MLINSRSTLGAALVATILVLLFAHRSTGAEPVRHPMAASAEAEFFAALNDNPTEPESAVSTLLTAYAIDPGDASTSLWLGLNHLWLAAEGDRRDASAIADLYLAEEFLARAQELNPTDVRIPSWLIPTRQALASIEQRYEDLPALLDEMLAAYESDPNFHSFSVGLQSFDAEAGSERFEQGLRAMRDAAGCVNSDDLTCGNTARWPHNVEGFLVFLADFELKAGQPERARAVLDTVVGHPDFETWPHRQHALDRLAHLDDLAARYANDDEDDDPQGLFAASNGIACQACHGAR